MKKNYLGREWMDALQADIDNHVPTIEIYGKLEVKADAVAAGKDSLSATEALMAGIEISLAQADRHEFPGSDYDEARAIANDFLARAKLPPLPKPKIL